MRQIFLPALALALAVAATAHAAPVGDVFVLDFENNNATIGAGNGSSFAPIYGATAAASYAPYINSLLSTNNGVNGNPGAVNPAWGQVSYTNQYHNAGDTNNTILAGNPGANDPNIHPSEPNYIWQESGSNLSINNDNDPYGSGGSVATIASYLATNPANLNGTTTVGQNLSGLLQAKGISWKSYQEGTGLLNSAGQPFNQNGGTLTNNVASAAQATVPLVSFSGTSTSYTNPYNGSHQYNFAAKHDGQLFFTDTNGGNDRTTANVEASHYSALENLQSDLTSNTVAAYNLITPDQFNDMHTSLTGGFTYHGTTYTGDQATIAQGDNFLSKIIPVIMASQAYQNNGVIIIWTDETEGSVNDSTDTLMEIVISKLAKGSIVTDGVGNLLGVYSDNLNFDHSSDVATMQDIFGVSANTPSGYLNNASSALPGGAQDLSDLFVPGTVSAIPEPASLGLLSLGAVTLLRRRARKV